MLRRKKPCHSPEEGQTETNNFSAHQKLHQFQENLKHLETVEWPLSGFQSQQLVDDYSTNPQGHSHTEKKLARTAL